jgi:hypothetical protein
MSFQDTLYLSNAGTNYQDGGFRLLLCLSNTLKADLHRFRVLAVEAAESMVDLRHQDGMPVIQVFLHNLVVWKSSRLNLGLVRLDYWD